MKKVCFVADRFFWEEEMGDLLYQEINKISNEDRSLSSIFILATRFLHKRQSPVSRNCVGSDRKTSVNNSHYRSLEVGRG